MSNRKKLANIVSLARRRGVLVGVAALLATIAVPTVSALASIPDSVTGAITGCVKNQGGALRVIDAQAGATCASDEHSLRWPGVGGAATTYLLPALVNLTHDGAQSTTVITGPVLPAGIWSLSSNVTVVNGTGQADTLRCGLNTGGGALISGTGATSNGYTSMSVPGLVTFTSPERVNVQCSHDSDLPAGPLVAVAGVVVAQQVASRF